MLRGLRVTAFLTGSFFGAHPEANLKRNTVYPSPSLAMKREGGDGDSLFPFRDVHLDEEEEDWGECEQEGGETGAGAYPPVSDDVIRKKLASLPGDGQTGNDRPFKHTDADLWNLVNILRTNGAPMHQSAFREAVRDHPALGHDFYTYQMRPLKKWKNAFSQVFTFEKVKRQGVFFWLKGGLSKDGNGLVASSERRGREEMENMFTHDDWVERLTGSAKGVEKQLEDIQRTLGAVDEVEIAASGLVEEGFVGDRSFPFVSMKSSGPTEMEELREVASKAKITKESVDLRETRKLLPAWQWREVVLESVRNHQVTVIVGDTGCGKTTQVPQLLLEEGIEKGEQRGIICTQPRRIAALSVADRVKSEFGLNELTVEEATPKRVEAGGLEGKGNCWKKLIGHQIRFQCDADTNTRLLYCTQGIFLKRILCDPDLSGVSHVVVDEVHERELMTDFSLTILRKLLARRPDLRLVVMSATINPRVFADYFDNTPRDGEGLNTVKIDVDMESGEEWPPSGLFSASASGQTGPSPSSSSYPSQSQAAFQKVKVLEIPGRMFPVKEVFLDEILVRSSWQWNPATAFSSSSSRGRGGRGGGGRGATPLRLGSQSQASCLRRAELKRKFPSAPDERIETALALLDAEAEQEAAQLRDDLVDLVVGVLADIERGVYPEESEDGAGLYRGTDGSGGVKDKGAVLVFLPGAGEIDKVGRAIQDNYRLSSSLWVLRAHSMLSPDEQKMVFKRAPKGMRKVVLSTNIAETSVTIDDIVYIIDSGLLKMTSYNPDTGASGMAMTRTSKANSRQRKGRAGRVRPGWALFLFSETAHRPEEHPPEMERTPVEELLIQTKMLRMVGSRQSCWDFLSDCISPPDIRNYECARANLRKVGALCYPPVWKALRKKETKGGGGDAAAASSSSSSSCSSQFRSSAVGGGGLVGQSPLEASDDEEDVLTPLGFLIGLLPVHPALANAMLLSLLAGQLHDVTAVCSILGWNSPFILAPKDQDNLVQNRKLELTRGETSDHLLYRNLLFEYRESNSKGSFSSKYFCSPVTLRGAANLYNQLLDQMQTLFPFLGQNAQAISVSSRNGIGGPQGSRPTDELLRLFGFVLTRSLTTHEARFSPSRNGRPTYRVGVDGHSGAAFPSSICGGEWNKELWRKFPPKAFLLNFQLMKTSKLFIRDITFVDPHTFACASGSVERVDSEKWRHHLADLCVTLSGKRGFALHQYRTQQSRLERLFFAFLVLCQIRFFGTDEKKRDATTASPLVGRFLELPNEALESVFVSLCRSFDVLTKAPAGRPPKKGEVLSSPPTLPLVKGRERNIEPSRPGEPKWLKHLPAAKQEAWRRGEWGRGRGGGFGKNRPNTKHWPVKPSDGGRDDGWSGRGGGGRGARGGSGRGGGHEWKMEYPEEKGGRGRGGGANLKEEPVDRGHGRAHREGPRGGRGRWGDGHGVRQISGEGGESDDEDDDDEEEDFIDLTMEAESVLDEGVAMENEHFE
uniref:Uncharacterized protein n=1 Tax=Chromera velia CCMP2878 TaxID=1169474 RepID=A0A0G4HCF0_9ALVE|eukprot:Cvel_6259.t1-p1 / transcript=Cvel_6259.t1 / gene=Cvel_6259 / organism=Chromera_velia_CCMP2878 / gene_product=ATP-dependent RNA helicase DHX29, putative / transcript_product=ATP-dependent RNA helicase DHX29, putative / location=Cvel_scaffold303:44858-58312(-) / protein_length=1484 / sequence_SO=supercontig / SO=protein_coding / is_pseudo=false